MRLFILAAVLVLSACAERQPPAVATPQPSPAASAGLPAAKVGKASIYARSFDGKPTASGKPLNEGADVVASNALPLGSKAKVTNLESGKSAIVTVEDRGRLPKGRVVDLTPATAAKIGVSQKEGVAPVSVQPTAPSPP